MNANGILFINDFCHSSSVSYYLKVTNDSTKYFDIFTFPRRLHGSLKYGFKCQLNCPGQLKLAPGLLIANMATNYEY